MAADYGHFEVGSSASPLPVRPWRGPRVIIPLESVDAELLLQARRRGRVLEHQPLVRIDIAMRLLRHQRALVEAAQDQLELAGIGVDVANGEDAGHAGFECGCLDRYQIVLEFDTPVRDRTELHGEPEERQHGIAADIEGGVVVALDDGARELAALAFERSDLAELEI